LNSAASAAQGKTVMASLLVGFISGSTVELARVSERKDGIRLVSQSTFDARLFTSFDSILRLYLRKTRAEFTMACLGVAGPVIDETVSTTKLAWRISSVDLKRDFGFRKVRLVNDVVASAHGISQLEPDKIYLINHGIEAPKGNLGLISAGSGLGEAIIFIEGGKQRPIASEGGHADFAPANQLETELWQYLYSELGRVEVEDVVSFRGLESIFNFLVDTQGGKRGGWLDDTDDRPGKIIEMALAGKDDTASRALDVFVDCYASEAANLALKGMTLGGIYIGGLIAPGIVTVLDRGRFMRRFVKRGKMETMLSQMPVGVIIDERTPLLGAAAIGMTL
jgi:glucokinase